MKNSIRKIYWILSEQFGIDFRRFYRSMRGIPRYLITWMKFRRHYKGQMDFMPCLNDWYEEGGSAQSEYFLQDLHVARAIHLAQPTKHVDIGSRIDGFVAHLASFREVEVFDIRPITSPIEGVIFKQADLMDVRNLLNDYCDSLSCLHALEHFGLGRYGDAIDPKGYVSGLENMIRLLKPSGTFYLSVPVGQERVEFNAHRVFNPLTLVQLANQKGLVLKALTWVGSDLRLIQSSNIPQDLNMLSEQRYGLGIFTFIKN